MIVTLTVLGLCGLWKMTYDSLSVSHRRIVDQVVEEGNRLTAKVGVEVAARMTKAKVLALTGSEAAADLAAEAVRTAGKALTKK